MSRETDKLKEDLRGLDRDLGEVRADIDREKDEENRIGGEISKLEAEKREHSDERRELENREHMLQGKRMDVERDLVRQEDTDGKKKAA